MTNRDPNSQFPYYFPINGKFIVKNTSKDKNKTINIFNYPIKIGEVRDLLKIPEIGPEEIRISLLKGTLRNKLIIGEIEIVDSDIDLLQFNSNQKTFLQQSGVSVGLEIEQDQINSNVSLPNSDQNYRQDIRLLGDVNDINTLFTLPIDPINGTSTFIFDFLHKLLVYKNGVKQYYMDDYTIGESGGPGTGYNTIIFAKPPTPNPPPADIITADYYTSSPN